MNRKSERDDASQISTDSETIRTWADAHDARPFRHQDEERYRVVSSDAAGDSHERVDWDEFQRHLEEGDSVVIYHGEEADEPFEVTEREQAFSRSNVSREELEERLIEGETVTSTVTETTVVEEVIVEEATIESELVDTEITDERVINVELLSRECTECTLEDTGTVGDREWFDESRYMETVGNRQGGQRTESMTGAGTTDTTGTTETTGSTEPASTTGTTGSADTANATEGESTGAERSEAAMTDVDEEYPFSAHLDVEEAWSVTREFTERFTVESRVEEVDVAETDSIEDRDIDVEGLQRTIVEGDVLDLNLSADEVFTEYDVETEFSEDDTMRTHFTRSRIVEDEMVDRRRVRADVSAADTMEFERIDSTDVSTEIAEGMAGGAMGGETATDEGTTGDAATSEGMTGDATGSDERSEVPLSDDEVGKTVVDASEEEIGMVTDVSDDGERMYVDAHPGITEKIKAALDWGDASEDDYTIEVDQVDHVTRDEIQLKGAEEIDEMTPTP